MQVPEWARGYEVAMRTQPYNLTITQGPPAGRDSIRADIIIAIVVVSCVP